MFVLYQDRVHRMTWDDGLLRAAAGSTALDRFLDRGDLRLYEPFAEAPEAWDDPQQFRDHTGFGALVKPVIAYARGGTGASDLQIVPPADEGRAELFVVAPIPEDFGAQGNRLGERRGYVVYQFHLSKPETPNGPSTAP
jgi:hypothetical protein